MMMMINKETIKRRKKIKRLFQIVKAKTVEDIENHKCIRVGNIKVCTCIFEVQCPLCKKILQYQSISGAKKVITSHCYCKQTKFKGKKSVISINIGKRLEVGDERITIGTIGEMSVMKELISRNYQCYNGFIGREKYIDLFTFNPKSMKSASIQVKCTDFNHNNYISNNGTTMSCFKQDEVNFDFLICYMINYDFYVIIPKHDLKTVFLSSFWQKQKKTDKGYVDKTEEDRLINVRVRWNQLYEEYTKIHPYINAWHLIDDFLE